MIRQNKFAYVDLNMTNQIGGFLNCSVYAKKKTNSEYHKSSNMSNATKLNLFANAPVRQNGNSMNGREFLIIAL